MTLLSSPIREQSFNQSNSDHWLSLGVEVVCWDLFLDFVIEFLILSFFVHVHLLFLPLFPFTFVWCCSVTVEMSYFLANRNSMNSYSVWKSLHRWALENKNVLIGGNYNDEKKLISTFTRTIKQRVTNTDLSLWEDVNKDCASIDTLFINRPTTTSFAGIIVQLRLDDDGRSRDLR